MILFCPKCGKDTDIFYDNVCLHCFSRDKKLIECPSVIRTRICPTCGGKWQKKEEGEAIVDCVRAAMKLNKNARNIEIALSPKQLDYSRYNVRIEAKAEIKGARIETSREIEVRISWETCDTCSRISGRYFEGIVQVRADKRFPTDEELERCMEIAKKVASRAQEKGDRLAFIPKTVEIEEGLDIYVGSIRLGRQICRAITDVLGGRFKESPKLVGQKNGEDIYRITFALRLPEFVRGDVISVDSKVIEVQSCGKHVSGIDLETGRRFIENFSGILEVKKLGSEQDAVNALLIADEGKTIQVMDPETYKTVTIRRPEFLSIEPGNEIRVIKTPKGIYVLPP